MGSGRLWYSYQDSYKLRRIWLIRPCVTLCFFASSPVTSQPQDPRRFPESGGRVPPAKAERRFEKLADREPVFADPRPIPGWSTGRQVPIDVVPIPWLCFRIAAGKTGDTGRCGCHSASCAVAFEREFHPHRRGVGQCGAEFRMARLL